MKRLIALAFGCVVSVGPVIAAPTFVPGHVPHFYEFDENENPKGFYWCGHAALKIVGTYKTGIDKPLSSIHKTFSANSPRGYANDRNCYSGSNHWCAKLQDLLWAAKYTQNGGFGRTDSLVRTVSDIKTFYQKVKDGVNNKFPPVVPSMVHYGDAGHFWVITGYQDGRTVESSQIYVRDVAMPSRVMPEYDRVFYVREFYDGSVMNGIVSLLYMK